MASYAYVENNIIVSVHDQLPQNWKNISNFYALVGDERTLNQSGWYTIIKTHIPHDPRYTTTTPQYVLKDNGVYEIVELLLSEPQSSDYITEEQARSIHQTEWSEVRSTRDQKMRDFEWKYNRYYREQRLGTPTTDQLNDLDIYMQQLADITSAFQHPSDVVWPQWNNKQ